MIYNLSNYRFGSRNSHFTTIILFPQNVFLFPLPHPSQMPASNAHIFTQNGQFSGFELELELLPSLLPLINSCMHFLTDVGAPQFMIISISGTLTPKPKADIQKITLNLLSNFGNSSITFFLALTGGRIMIHCRQSIISILNTAIGIVF